MDSKTIIEKWNDGNGCYDCESDNLHVITEVRNDREVSFVECGECGKAYCV